MKTFLVNLLIILCFNKSSAQESNNMHKNYIEIGLNGGTYFESFTGGGYGAAGFFFTSFGKKSRLDFRAKENYIFSPEREAGSITLMYSVYLNKGYYLGAGFAHNHEMEFNSFLDDAMRAIIGTSKNIIHRSGIAIETGYDFKSIVKKSSFGIYLVTNLCLAYFPMDKEPNPLLTLSVGLRFGFKKM